MPSINAVPGYGDGRGYFTERRSLAITAAAFPTPLKLQFSREFRTYAFKLPSAINAGEVLVSFAQEGRELSSLAMDGFILDPVKFPVLRLDVPSSWVYVYCAAGLTGNIEVFGIAGDVEPAGGAASAAPALQAVNVTQLASVAGADGVAALPSLNVLPYGRPGGTVNAADWDTAPVSCADTVTTLLLAGDTGRHAALVVPAYSSAAAAGVYVRRTSTNADGGPNLRGDRDGFIVDGGGSAIYIRNNSGAARVVSVAGIKGYA